MLPGQDAKKYSDLKTYEKNTQRMLAQLSRNISYGFNNCPTTAGSHDAV